ncbi:MAG: GAF domain-containing sensor histidine kinase [Chitinophagaceae bacterium]|nr:GAF domain-containing sensor histidine kinase [Chitinophagaceae bacterium]
MGHQAPLPDNELDRVISLSELDLDYAALQDTFKDLTKLAAKVAGTEVSLVNLIDSFTQWSISQYGIDLEQMPREDSVCQYTIVTKDAFEVKDLSADERFKDKDYVTGGPKLRYYFGVPLQTSDGYQLGALCVLDKVGKEISPEKVEMLKIISNEIVNRLMFIKSMNLLRNSVKEARDVQRKVAHDIRGPLSGIVGLTQIISEQGKENTLDDVLQLVDMIQKGGSSLLDLANEILTNDLSKETGKQKGPAANEFNLPIFRDKLERLYKPQANAKGVNLSIEVDEKADYLNFPRNKLMQITGNLISNAIKFTPANGWVNVLLGITLQGKTTCLSIAVRDNGKGMDAATIENIQSGNVSSTSGTAGEQGYGFGLALVQHLIEKLGGTLSIESAVGSGTSFTVTLPL